MDQKRSQLSNKSFGLSGCPPLMRWLAFLLFCAIHALIALPAGAQESVTGVNPIPGFDHAQTGFALTGKHATLICESCHVDNKLKGTPRACVACHNGSLAKGKPKDHPPAGTQCTQCHTTRNFHPFAVNHTMISQPCATCHNGRTAFGKPANHIPANDQCDDCHVTTSRKDVRVDHRDVIGPCASCHNGKIAMGQPKDHIAAPSTCGSCHTTFQFKNPIVNHSMLFQPCATCHNGVIAMGKPPNHLPSPETCEDCHTPSFDRTFASASFDHSIALGDCASCHVAGNTWGAPPSPPWHLVVDMTDCDSCHFGGTSFTGAIMDHSRASSDTECIACHYTFGNNPPPNPNVTMPSINMYSPCSDCH
jgi:hypothetical protein